MDQVIIILISVLLFCFLLAMLYFSSTLKKQKQQIKNLESRCTKFYSRDVVEGIVDQMDKIKILVSSASDSQVSNNVTELGNKIKNLSLENEKLKTETISFKEFIKGYEKNYQKFETSLKEHQSTQQKLETSLTSIINGSHFNFQQNDYPYNNNNNTSGSSLPILHSFSNEGGIAGAGINNSQQSTANLSTFIKECPKPPIELKFTSDVSTADGILENTLNKI